MKNSKPNYYNIYTDILNEKFPEKIEECKHLLITRDLSVSEVMEINRIIFYEANTDTETFNRRYKSYRQSDILKILDYQKNNKLNNSELAKHFKLSRNTVTKWKRIFLV